MGTFLIFFHSSANLRIAYQVGGIDRMPDVAASPPACL